MRNMKNMMNLKNIEYIVILLLLFIQGAFSQDYPCQVMVNMSPPYPITLSGYGSSVQEKINLTVLLGDISESGREVGLKFYIEGSSGFRAGSGDVVTGTSPLVLEGGVPLYLTQSDLSPYFRYENLQGLNPQAYGALLPEGMYQFCFEVYDWQSKRVISARRDRKSTRLNSSHVKISYAVFCLNIRPLPSSPLFPYTTLFRSPLVLEGGVPLYLTQSDLSPYFRYENLQGLNPQAYGALLPEGMYQFCFEVYDWQSKRVISAR